MSLRVSILKLGVLLSLTVFTSSLDARQSMGPPAGPLNGVQQQIAALEARIAALEAQLAGGFPSGAGGGLIPGFAFFGPGEVRYSISPLGSTGNWTVPIPANGKLTALAVHPSSNTLASGVARIVVLVNGQETALAVEITNNATTVIVLPGNVPVSAGDSLTVKFDGAALVSGALTIRTSVLYAAQ